MPLGLEMFCTENKTFLTFVSKLATSIVSFLESVQNMFLADQSIAKPSGDMMPENNYKYLLNMPFHYFILSFKCINVMKFTSVQELFKF